MRGSRFTWALGAALCAHAAVASALALGRRSPAASSGASVPQELVFITEEQPPPEPLPVTPDQVPPVSALAPTPMRVTAPRASPVAVAAPSQPPSSPIDDARLAVPAPADSNGTWSLRQTGPTALGIGDYWRSVAGGASPAQATEASREHLPSVVRMMKDELAVHDLALGLGAGGPLVAAAHEAASPSFAPDVGSAVFDVEADATGLVTRAQLVSEGADSSAWNDVGRELVKRMAASPSKRLHLAAGARGLRARLRITAERTLPSGERRTSSTGAVPDDVPGGDSACVGQGAERKCIAGSPVGITQGIGDLSNIGARASRIVHVELLSEVTL